VWLSLLEYVVLAAGTAFRPQLVLISAGFDAHRNDPLGGCKLDAEAFGQMACQVRDCAVALGAPVGAVLEGGYDLDALAASVVATIGALSGIGAAESSAPEMIITPRVASRIGHYWEL
jgi:acetoin utilization deacetylase AcuC-like enzyme